MGLFIRKEMKTSFLELQEPHLKCPIGTGGFALATVLNSTDYTTLPSEEVLSGSAMADNDRQ